MDLTWILHWIACINNGFCSRTKVMNYTCLTAIMEVYPMIFFIIFQRIDCTTRELHSISSWLTHSRTHRKHRATITIFKSFYIKFKYILLLSGLSKGQHTKCLLGAMLTLCIQEHLQIKHAGVSVS